MRNLLQKNKCLETLSEKELIEIFKKEKDLNVKMWIIYLLKDEKNILKIVSICENRHKELALLAIEKISSDKLLYKIAVNTRSKNIFEEAIKKIKDQNLLYNIALKTKNKLSLFKIRGEVDEILGKISDQNIILKYLTNISCNPYIIRNIKIEKTETYSKIEKILIKFIKKHHRNKRKLYIVKEAIEKIENPEILFQFAIKNYNKYVRVLAISKIENQDKLRLVFESTDIFCIKYAAIKKITGQYVLYNIAINNKENELLRCEAVKNIYNQELLKKLFFKLSKSDLEVKRAILESIKLPIILFEIYLKTDNISIKNAAINKIHEKGYTFEDNILKKWIISK